MLKLLDQKKKSAPWVTLANEARAALYEPRDLEAVDAITQRLEAFYASEAKSARRPEIKAMLTLAYWHRTGELTTNYQNLNEARVQLWEYELNCPVYAFQLEFLRRINTDFPGADGPAQLLRLHEHCGPPISSRFDDFNSDVVVLRTPNAEATILGFSAIGGKIPGISWTLYDRAVAQKLNANLIILRDTNIKYYLAGIASIGDLEQSIASLRAQLQEFAGTKVIATGGSAGVFGALLYSCALGIEHVVVSSGPTSLDIGVDQGDRQRFLIIKQEAEKGLLPYPDLAQDVANSAIRRVDYFVGGAHEFDMRQMRNLQSRTSVVVPHIYEDNPAHATMIPAILDGSLLNAFRTSP